MTLLIGIRTNYGTEGIVIASDRQLSESEDNGKGVVESKRAVRKIFYGPFWAIGACGGDYREIIDFCRTVNVYRSTDTNKQKQAQEIVERAIRDRWFREVRDLNTLIMKKGSAEIGETASFILAVTKPKMAIWKVDEFGNFKDIPEENDFEYLSLGSGSDTADGYIKQQLAEERIDRDQITIQSARRIACGALSAANTVGSVGMGYDLAVLTGIEIKDWGSSIRRGLQRAQSELEKGVDDYYPEPPEKESGERE